MKKRIIVLIIILLLTTGCTCEYNLNIDGNTYKEEINILGTNSEEINTFNNDWKIPVDKDEYNNISGESGTEIKISGDIYTYELSGNNLIFSYDFTRNRLNNSTAISNCYDKATIQSYENSIVISTSNKVTCFDKYPTLSNIKINITTDKSVTSHNADNVNGNTYTWHLTKNNSSDKSINMIIDNKENNSENQNNPNDNSNNQSQNNNNNNKDYTLYIFCGILLIILLFGYFISKKIINKNNDEMDD